MQTIPLASVLLGTVLAAGAAPAAAQYKWVEPGGQVHYSDLPPPPGITPTMLGKSAGPRGSGDSVPAALRDAMSNHPVVLYTTSDCAPCQQARQHLTRRGIPFVERSVGNAADAEAFRKAGFNGTGFPAVSVGRDRSTGFEGEEWNRLLDAAGYPKNSVLPAGYRSPPPVAAATPRRATEDDDAGGVMTAEVARGTRDGARGNARDSAGARRPAPRAELAPVPVTGPGTTVVRF